MYERVTLNFRKHVLHHAEPGGHAGKKMISVFLLVLCSMVWGFAFVSQSVGAEYVGPFTFLAIRCWIAVAFLIPAGRILYRPGQGKGKTVLEELTGRRRLYLAGGAVCGLALFLASAAQQIGIGYTTTAKAGFITALYVVLVPVLSVFTGHMPRLRIWFCVVLGLVGLYFLCMSGDAGRFNKGDAILLLCALLFSVQIMAVGHFSGITDGILLSLMQTLTEGVLAVVFMLFLERPEPAMIKAAMPALLYAGIMSSGVGYTLQILGQDGLEPTLASLIMSLESVFSAVGGWLILGQRLNAREISGCAIMFLAIIISQLPVKSIHHTGKGFRSKAHVSAALRSVSDRVK